MKEPDIPDTRLECWQAFNLAEAFEPGALRVKSRELVHGAFELARAELRPERPIDYVRDEGRTPHDLIGTTDAVVTLVSDRLIAILRAREFRGWTTFPVQIFLDDGSTLDGYLGLAVTGRSGPIDDRFSEDAIQPPPVSGGQPGRALRGLCFEPESWDGSDIFTPEGYAGRFVVEAVKNALEEAGVSNVEFRRLSEIERIWRADGSVIESD
jgi:hypothetical protein